MLDDDDDDEAYARTSDPVRMYLRKMGTVALLTREGEVEIAKRIEEALVEVAGAPRDHCWVSFADSEKNDFVIPEPGE